MMSAFMEMNMCNRWRASTKHTKTNTEDVTNNNSHESISQVSVALKKREAQHGTLQEAQQGFGETRRHLETASRVVGDNMTLLSDG